MGDISVTKETSKSEFAEMSQLTRQATDLSSVIEMYSKVNKPKPEHQWMIIPSVSRWL